MLVRAMRFTSRRKNASVSGSRPIWPGMDARLRKAARGRQAGLNWHERCTIQSQSPQFVRRNLPAMLFLPSLFGSKKTVTIDKSRVWKLSARAPEKVRAVRKPVYREACVIYPSGYRRKGVVMDYSDKGVRIRFPTNETLPARVSLDARLVGMAGDAAVVWQTNSEVGLHLRG